MEKKQDDLRGGGKEKERVKRVTTHRCVARGGCGFNVLLAVS